VPIALALSEAGRSGAFPVSAAVTIVAKGYSGIWNFTVATCTLFLQNHQVEPAGDHSQ
jgi:hypothetical protein